MTEAINNTAYLCNFVEPAKYFTINLTSSVKYVRINNVTLLHLRSKEPKRIHKPYIPLSRDTTKCTPVYIQMYPGKVLHIKDA